MEKIRSWWRELSPEYRRKTSYLCLGLAIFLLILSLPTPGGLTVAGQRALAILAFVVALWVTETFTLGLTALIGVALLPLLNVIDLSESFIGFGSTPLFFLAGAFTLGIAMQKTDLHKRMALKILKTLGKSTSTLIFGVVLLGAFMSMTIPCHAVAALMLPVLMGIVTASGVDQRSNFGIAIFLALTYGTSVGSLASILGGARNVLAIGILKEMGTVSVSISFLDWMVAGLPIAITLMLFTYVVVRIVYPWDDIDIDKAREHMEDEVSSMGSMSSGEKKAAIIFILCFGLWVFLGTTIGLATVAVGGMILLVATRTITWREVEEGMPWGLLFLYGGALTLSHALTETQAVDFLAGKVMGIAGGHTILLVLVMLALVVLLTNLMSDSASTAVILPIAIPTITGLGISSLLPTYLVAMGSALAFMLPIATPSVAIAYSSGYLKMKDLIKTGLYLSIIGVIVFMTVGLGWWKILGIW